ncbi:MAG: hypothetical protein IJL45_02205 [Prevotella sp.]|nr:hypothetical protein [Prevotella sp.]
MKKIQFTLGDSNVWHTFYANLELNNEVQTGQLVSYLIQQELNKIRECTAEAKKVQIYDENNELLATSNDIHKIEELIFKIK